MDQLKIIGIAAGAIAATIPGVLLWRRIGWRKTLGVIIGVCFVDLDHFLFTNQAGFLQVPGAGAKIMHSFHTIEFLLVVVAINLIDTPRGRNWNS